MILFGKIQYGHVDMCVWHQHKYLELLMEKEHFKLAGVHVLGRMVESGSSNVDHAEPTQPINDILTHFLRERTVNLERTWAGFVK